MTTARDCIKAAMRRIRVLESGEEPTAEEGADALEMLNDMMFGFNGDGIEFVHTTLALADNINVPDEQVEHIKNMLAVKLCDEYKKVPTPTLMALAENGRRYMQAAYHLPQAVRVDGGAGPRTDATFNYTTGR